MHCAGRSARCTGCIWWKWCWLYGSSAYVSAGRYHRCCQNDLDWPLDTAMSYEIRNTSWVERDRTCLEPRTDRRRDSETQTATTMQNILQADKCLSAFRRRLNFLSPFLAFHDYFDYRAIQPPSTSVCLHRACPFGSLVTISAEIGNSMSYNTISCWASTRVLPVQSVLFLLWVSFSWHYSLFHHC